MSEFSYGDLSYSPTASGDRSFLAGRSGRHDDGAPSERVGLWQCQRALWQRCSGSERTVLKMKEGTVVTSFTRPAALTPRVWVGLGVAVAVVIVFVALWPGFGASPNPFFTAVNLRTSRLKTSV